MIKVLIVDDSHTTMEYLKYLLDSDDDIMIVGIAEDGIEAVDLANKKSPDLILMDINMPRMNGFQATQIIMENNPVPIIIMSSIHDTKETEVVFKAMESGALNFVNKPRGIDHPDHEQDYEELLQNVKILSEVKVVRRRKSKPRAAGKSVLAQNSHGIKTMERSKKINMIVIGASAGGPPVLQKILSKLPENFPVPILVVQHISKGFIDGLIKWIGASISCEVHLADQGDKLLPGYVYFAPDDYHMGVGNSGRIILSRAKPERNSRPSISFLFRSAAEQHGQATAGILLTGMGKDGADGLKILKDKGAVTIVQDKESSMIHGMAGEAINLKAAMYELSPESIADMLIHLVYNKI